MDNKNVINQSIKFYHKKKNKKGETIVSQTFKKEKKQNTAIINLKAQYINKQMILI